MLQNFHGSHGYHASEILEGHWTVDDAISLCYGKKNGLSLKVSLISGQEASWTSGGESKFFVLPLSTLEELMEVAGGGAVQASLMKLLPP